MNRNSMTWKANDLTIRIKNSSSTDISGSKDRSRIKLIVQKIKVCHHRIKVGGQRTK